MAVKPGVGLFNLNVRGTTDHVRFVPKADINAVRAGTSPA